MGKKVIKQVLSNETLNDHNYVVFSDGINWDRYKNNPILCLDHYSNAVLGTVGDIHREGDDWVGEFNFDELTSLSVEKKKQYEAGTLRGASISGIPYYYEKDGIRFATKFDIYEISLVSLPANPDCVSVVEGLVSPVQFNIDEGKAVKLEQFSSEINEKITKFLSKMAENVQQTPATEHTVDKEPQNVDETVSLRAKESTENVNHTEEVEKKIWDRLAEAIGFAFKPTTQETATKTEDTPKEDPKPTEEFSAQPTESTEPRMSDAASKIGQSFSSKSMEKKTIHEYLHGKEGQEKFADVCAFSSDQSIRDGKELPLGAKELIAEFVHTAKNDAGFMSFMGNTTATIGADNKYMGTAAEAIDRLTAFASGINSMSFIESTPDLARIEWLTLIYRLLLPEESWANRCARVSGEDRAGVIWINSAISPRVYFGKRAPLGQTATAYDDTPVGIIMNLFAVAPILWQQANSDLLAYDPMSLGQSEALRVLQYKIHNFYLQQFTEAASVTLGTTGTTTYSATGAFPANPTATGTLKYFMPQDIINMQTAFINQNYTMDRFEGEMVMPAAMFNQLQTNDNVANLLYKNSGSLFPNYAEYSGFVLRPRPITSLYDSASSAIVDPELYLDGKINDTTGAVPTYTPPVLANTAVGNALAFIPSECVIALGRTNVHMVASPENYGWMMSMDIRTGAGAARTGGKGIGVIYPSVNA